MTQTRWGILGTGKIADAFALAVRELDDGRLVAVGSRTAATARAFAERHDIPHRHAAYEGVAADPEVDVVYVATPHTLHHANTLLCLEAGKAVLCEKPLAVNATEAEEMITVARSRELFLMEAIWTLFQPAVARLREILAAGEIGEPRLVRADFCFRAERRPGSRLFERELGGGALLDVGIYPVAVAAAFFGDEPLQVAGLPHFGPTGVDELSGVVLDYGHGRLAVISSGNRLSTPNEAVLAGSRGWVKLHHPFWHPQRLTVSVGGVERSEDHPYRGNGYVDEAEEVGRCLAAGRLESAIHPLDRSLAIARTLDRIREPWGLVYPADEPV